MERAEKKRKLILGSLLIATLILIFLIEDEAEIYPIQPVQSMQPKKSYAETESANENNSEYLDIAQLGQRKFNGESGELFNAMSWTASGSESEDHREQRDSVLKQTIQRAAASVASKPPPIRFRYLGKIIHNNQMKIILSQSDEKIVVKLGEHIDDQYRVDAMDSETITLTYLPLNIKQTLIINDPGNKR